MKRALLKSIGWEETLGVEEVKRPEPTGDQVLIEVEACGVCFRDCIDRVGRFPFIQTPITPGHEAVGRVIGTGSDVTEWQLGDRIATMHRDFCGTCPACQKGHTTLCRSAAWVFGLMAHGGYATHIAAPERCFYRASDTMPPQDAAILHCTFGTAFRSMVTAGGLEAGEHVLITGANGGVGAAAVVLAKRLGATVTAVVRSGGSVGFVESMGADTVLLDDGQRFHKLLGSKRADIVVDCVGQPTFNAGVRSLNLGGRLIVVGNVVSDRASLNLGYVVVNGITIRGSGGATREDMAQVVELYNEHPFSVPVFDQVSLEEADEAQRRVQRGGLHGRIVVIPTS